MKTYEILNENFPFHADTTEMPFYDDMMKNPEYFARKKGLKSRLVQMSPDEYIDTVSKNKNISPEELLQTRDKALIDEYSKLMKKGHKFPILTLDYSKHKQVSQEGLHRSFAAKRAGIKKVPVLIVDLTDEEKEYLRNR